MLPVVPQVVHILELGPHMLNHVVDSGLLYIDDLALVIQVWHGIYFAANPELVQMTVLPAHDHLQHAMELSKRHVFPNQNPPPDRRMNVPQRHLELIHGTILFHGHDYVSPVRKGHSFTREWPQQVMSSGWGHQTRGIEENKGP